MTAPAAAIAEVVVNASPDDAFAIFTDEIGLWWRRDTPYWNDPERGLTVRLEPFVGGRFMEIYDLETAEGFEVGRVTAWEPGERVAFTWTQVGWPEDASTDVEISFKQVGGGTRVRLEQTGFERVGPEGESFRERYSSGWREVLGWFAERATTGRSST